MKHDPWSLHQQRSWTKVQVPNSSPGSFYFFTLTSKREEALGTKLHKVWTRQKKVGIMCSNPCCIFEPCCLHELAKPRLQHLNYLVWAFHPNKIRITKDNIKSGLQKTTWFKPACLFLTIISATLLNTTYIFLDLTETLPFTTNFMKTTTCFNLSGKTAWFKPSSLFLNFLKKAWF